MSDTDEKLRMDANSSFAVISHGRQTWLHDAVERKDLELIRRALDCSPSDFGELDVRGRSPLVTAMLGSIWEVVSVMLDCRTVDILAISRTDFVVDALGQTVYHKLGTADRGLKHDAVDKDDTERCNVLRRLVGCDRNFNVVGLSGNTPLHTAAESNNDVVDVFCTDDNVNAQNYKGFTPLHVAVRKGNRAAALTLLQHGADVRLTDQTLNTPTHFVSLSNYDKFSSVFASVNLVNTRNVFGQLSPLLWLSPDGDVDVNYQDYLGNTVLHAVAGVNDHLGLKHHDKTLFLSEKFHARCYENRNLFGQTPIHLMLRKDSNNFDLLKLSQERLKMSLTATDGRGRNIFHQNVFPFKRRGDSVARGGRVDGAVHIPNSELKSKGRWCIYSRLDADFQRLTRNGGVDDVIGCCSRDSLGRTPLHFVAMYGGLCKQCGNYGCWCTCCLYLFGVDGLRIQDAFGKTPLHNAAMTVDKPKDSVRLALSMAGFIVDDVYNDVKDIDGFTPHQIDNNVVKNSYRNRSLLDVDIESLLSHSKTIKSPYKSQLWSQFAARIDTWLLWQEELKSGPYSPNRRQLTATVYSAVTSFMERLVDAIGREDTRLRGRLLAVGSAFEQTKLDWPNEFDFNVVLLNFTNICQICRPGRPSGFRVLRKIPDIDLLTEKYAAYSEFFYDGDTLKTPAVNFCFQRALVKVLSWQTFWDNEPLLELSDLKDFYKMTPNKLCKKLKLTVNRPILGRHISCSISIDVVPVIHFPGWWPEDGIQVDNDIRSEGCNFVFYQPRCYRVPFSPDRYYVMISFARAESLLLIRPRNCVVRAAYIVAKRIWQIVYKSQVNFSLNFRDLKAAALGSICAVGDDDDCLVVSETALRTQVVKLFAKLYEFAVADRSVSSFLPSLSFKLWKYETFVGYAHTFLWRTSMDYETLLNAEVQNEISELKEGYDNIRQSLLVAYLLYAAVSSRDIE